MSLKLPIGTAIAVALSLILSATIAPADDPSNFQIQGIKRTKQFTNYCGPACMESVLKHYGSNKTQKDVGNVVYEAATGSTNGADMLLYARNLGFDAYSWNSGIRDVKSKISAGVPVIVLQQNSTADTSGHFRVLTGYDDNTRRFDVMDPYYDNITQLSYAQCERLWKSMGYWALAIVPTDKDTFSHELSDENPVVHMDLSSALYKQHEYDKALKEINIALNLEPGNSYAMSIAGKIRSAAGAKRR